MCYTDAPGHVRRVVQEIGVAIRGRWPSMLRTGWVESVHLSRACQLSIDLFLGEPTRKIDERAVLR